MEKLGVVFGGGVALSFFCYYVDYDGLLQLFDPFKDPLQLLYVVSVQGANVFKAQVYEHVVAQKEALQAPLEPKDKFLQKAASRHF